MPPRIGLGFDNHRLVPGKGFRLGGVDVSCGLATEAHSDGDVLLHALVDAMLGAAALGDIGDHFPDTDARWKDADSRVFVEWTLARLADAGFAVGNVDANVLLEKPKLGPLKDAMRASIAAMLKVDPDVVSVKAKTHERVGPVGHSQTVVAQVVVLLNNP